MKTINEEVNRRINDRLARLAEHAPDMLAMLERVTSEYNALGRVVDPVLGANNSTISEARQLIAKVKGEA